MYEPAAKTDRIAFALDVPSLQLAERWVQRLHPHVGVFKVGLQLFSAFGKDAIKVVTDHGGACFLDLKFHDIPKTMAHATEEVAKLGVRYLTVHAVAGEDALRECVDAAGDRLTLLAVTVLTSMDAAALASTGVSAAPDDQVLHLAKLSASAGVGGLVCSVHESRCLREEVPSLIRVVPGIRLEGGASHDQKRVGTPAMAAEAGADILVVGRAIRDAKDPEGVARQILEGLQ